MATSGECRLIPNIGNSYAQNVCLFVGRLVFVLAFVLARNDWGWVDSSFDFDRAQARHHISWEGNIPKKPVEMTFCLPTSHLVMYFVIWKICFNIKTVSCDILMHHASRFVTVVAYGVTFPWIYKCNQQNNIFLIFSWHVLLLLLCWRVRFKQLFMLTPTTCSKNETFLPFLQSGTFVLELYYPACFLMFNWVVQPPPC